MSEQSIFDKSQEIRNEVLSSGNTKERVSDVLDDINSTKANKIDLLDKLSITTETTSAPDDDFKYVYILDEDNVPKRMLAGDLGKNVANSALTSVAGAGLTLGANWDINTSGFYYSITGLADVSNDSTFDTVLTQNSSGRVAKSNGKGVFVALPTLLSDAEKNIWKTAMNGGWTTNTISVAVISPPIADNSDKNYWFTIKGANLNFSPTNFKIELIADDGVSVVAEIPNSQVQLYTSGIDLVFYYNFKDIPVGEYKIRLWNGVAYYTTGAAVTVKIVTQLTPLPLNSLTWETIQKTDGVNDVVSASGNGVNLNVVPANATPVNNDELVAAAKSSLLVGANQNFYIKGTFTLFAGKNTGGGAIIGVGTDSPISMINTTGAFVKFIGSVNSGSADKFYYAGVSNNSIYLANGLASGSAIGEFIIIRSGNSASIIISSAGKTAIGLNVISEDALHLFGYAINGAEISGNYARSSIAITEGFEF